MQCTRRPEILTWSMTHCAANDVRRMRNQPQLSEEWGGTEIYMLNKIIYIIQKK